MNHFQKLAVHLERNLEDPDWNRRREIIRTLVERIEIGLMRVAIVFRLPHGITVSTKDPVIVTLPRA